MTSGSTEAQLFDGFAALLAPVTGGAPISAREMPDTPDRAVVLTIWATGAHPSIPLDYYSMQVRSRGVADDDLDADELADPIRRLLHGSRRQFGPVYVDDIRFRYSAPMGVDARSRTERADVYDLDVSPVPDANRPA